MTGTIGVVAALDFARGTKHLDFPRYTLLAGPGAYLVIAAGCIRTSSRNWRWAGHVLAAIVTALAFGATLTTPRDWRDYRMLAAMIDNRVQGGDVIVFASGNQKDEWAVGALYLGFDHYSEAPDHPILLLRRGLSDAARQRLRRASHVWLVVELCDSPSPETVLPGFKPVEGGYVNGYPAGIWLMR
jgi:hypothetical protein